LNRYHWFVLVVSALGWLFDCLDQQLFILARPAAMKDLLSHITDMKLLESESQKYGDIATSVFIAGWATGGLIFGMLGDRIGRAKTMLITILMYSLFTGLSALSVSVYDFAFYRFLTGLGVGGEFAVGVALVAEVMPAVARPYALSLLQALSAFGNISAGAEGRVVSTTETYRELFGHPVWRRHALLGLALACSGVIGLWAVGFYVPDLTRTVQTKPVTAAIYASEIQAAETAGNTARVAALKQVQEALAANQLEGLSSELQAVKKSVDPKIKGRLTYYQSFSSIAINIGAFCGMFGFGALSQRIGRKPTFAIALVAAFVSTVTVFWTLQDLWQIFVLVPIMGFCQLSLFGGYAVYFPELFPTRLRSTGVSFCYNVGRFVAAVGPLVKMWLNEVFKETAEPLRYAGVTMCLVFLVGLVVLPFLPETLGKPLPE